MKKSFSGKKWGFRGKFPNQRHETALMRIWQIRVENLRKRRCWGKKEQIKEKGQSTKRYFGMIKMK